MIIPIRCFTCGKEIASRYKQYLNDCKMNKNTGEVLDNLGMDRICCRRMFLGQVDIIDKLLMFELAKPDTNNMS